ncbi:MAG: hypothetical protein J7K89_00995 [Candidatus Cloacimonetes bacterium]|nr:hypothetical protein [Candidatus Cloacimonadota bacterium]
MKRRLLTLLLAMVLLFTFVACSENDDNNTDPNGNDAEPPALATVADLTIAIPDSASLANYTSETISYGGVDYIAYNLNQFIMDAMNDTTALEYSFEIVSSDGYSPRNGGNPDLAYADVATGYLLPANKYRTYFPSDDIFTAYNVKYADHFNLYSTVTVKDEDGESIPFETGAIETEEVYHQAGNGNFYTDPGFKLTQFISEYVTEDAEDFSYFFTASDGYTMTYTWAELQSGWWLPDNHKAVFIDENGVELLSSFKHLISIELVE